MYNVYCIILSIMYLVHFTQFIFTCKDKNIENFPFYDQKTKTPFFFSFGLWAITLFILLIYVAYFWNCLFNGFFWRVKSSIRHFCLYGTTKSQQHKKVESIQSSKFHLWWKFVKKVWGKWFSLPPIC